MEANDDTFEQILDEAQLENDLDEDDREFDNSAFELVDAEFIRYDFTRSDFNISKMYEGMTQLRCGRKIGHSGFKESSIDDPIVFTTPGYGSQSNAGKYPHKAK